MLNPSLTIAKLITDIKALAGYAALGLDDVIEINESPSRKVKPPYVGLYFDFDRPAPFRDSDMNLESVPYSIYALIFSRVHDDAPDSFSEVFTIMNTIQSAMTGIKTVSTKKIFIHFQEQPYSIMAYRADETILRLNLNVEEYL